MSAMIVWSIWNNRNDLVWNENRKQDALVIRTVHDSVIQCQLACANHHTGSQISVEDKVHTWRKPVWLKCNVDVAIFNQKCCIGHGCVLKNRQGLLVAAKNGLMHGPLDPMVAEAMSCKEALG